MNAKAPTPGYNCRLSIFFATQANGQQVAYRYSWRAGRAIRVSLADAKIWQATDAADVLPGHPWRP